MEYVYLGLGTVVAMLIAALCLITSVDMAKEIRYSDKPQFLVVGAAFMGIAGLAIFTATVHGLFVVLT